MKKILILALGVVAAGAQAASLYSTGFEPTTFTNNTTINNKGAWHTGSLNGSGTAVTGASVKATTAQAHSGTQSAIITAPSAAGGSFVYGYHAVSYDATTNADKIVNLETYIYLAQQNTTSGGSGLADIELDSGVGYAEAEAGIDTGTGQLTVGGYGNGGSGAGDYFFTFTNGPVANFGAWNKVDLTIDFSASTTSPKVTASLNNVTVDGGLTVYDFAASNGDVVSTIGFGDIQLYGGNTTAGDTNTLTAYYDDFNASTIAAVPEPAPIAGLALGAIVLIRRRRKA